MKTGRFVLLFLLCKRIIWQPCQLTPVHTHMPKWDSVKIPAPMLLFLLVLKWKIKAKCIHSRCVCVRVSVCVCMHAGSSVQHLLNQPKAARLLRNGSRFPMTSKVLLPLQFVELCQNHRMPFLILIMEMFSPKTWWITCQTSHNSWTLTLKWAWPWQWHTR